VLLAPEYLQKRNLALSQNFDRVGTLNNGRVDRNLKLKDEVTDKKVQL